MFNITEDDIQKTIETLLISTNPIQIKVFPSKEKRKYILLAMICHLFEKDKVYREKEISELLRPVFDDFVVLRRYLVDYKFLNREKDGSAYWLAIDPKDFLAYKIF